MCLSLHTETRNNPEVYTTIYVAMQGRIQNFAKGGSWLMTMVYIVQHNEHAKHANARGVWGDAPQENLKN